MLLSRILSRQPLAVSPRQFKISDWKDALLATKDAISNKRIGILAAGIAYFMTLAFFPLIAASIAIASFVIEPSQIQDVAQSVQAFFPKDIADLINDQLTSALDNKSVNAIIAVFAILLALFSVSGAAQNAVNASNAAYDVEEDRGFVNLRIVSVAVMLIFMAVGAIIIILLLSNAPALVDIGLHPILAGAISIGRWILLPVVLSVALAFFYRYGPNHKSPQWQWVSWGSVIAATLWLLVTVAFFVYARYFAHFSESYGTFAGIIVLMTWLNLSAFVILLGAEINNRLQRQTKRKTTKR